MHRGAGSKSLCFVFRKLFSFLSHSPRISPLVPSISDHQSRLYYYFFPQSALISRPPRRLSPLLFLNSQPPQSPHLFIHFSVLPSSSHSHYFSYKFFFFFAVVSCSTTRTLQVPKTRSPVSSAASAPEGGGASA